MAKKPSVVTDFKFKPSRDGQSLLLSVTGRGRKPSSYSIPLASLSKWISQQIEGVWQIGKDLPAPPDGTPRVIPWSTISVHRPLRVALSREQDEPILTMDFGPAVLAFKIKRDVIHHMLTKLAEYYPVDERK